MAASCSNPALLRRAIEDLAPTAVIGVEPRLFWNTCAGTAAVAGTQLRLRAADLSAETLAQLSDCHYARIYVGEEEKRSSRGAHWLSHGWLDVDAGVAGSEVTVLLSAETVPQNIRMFHEATTFARRTSSDATE